MKRPSRERERPAAGQDDDLDLEPRALSRSPARSVAPDPRSWPRRHWVSIVGVTVGVLFSLWRFGPSHNSMSRGGLFPAAEFHWHGAIAAGHQVEIKGFNGAVHAVAADGQEVEVTAIRRSQGRNPADVPIAVVLRDGNVTVCATAPGAGNDCGSVDEGPGRSGGVSVEYTVRVPKGVLFAANTVNGGISAEGLTAAVQVETVNGGIEISTTGGVHAQAVNGSIRASVGGTAGDLSFATVNGSIAVSLPSNASVDVKAQTVSGSISTDFPLNIPRTRPGTPKEASGQIGSGGHDLSMETVNGSIELKKASGSGGGALPPPPRGPGRVSRGRR